MPENGNGSPIQRSVTGFGSGFQQRTQQRVIAFDAAKFASQFEGVTEEEVSQKQLAIEAILANPDWNVTKKNREIEYILGIRKKREVKEKLSKEDKDKARAAKAREKREAKRADLERLGLVKKTVKRDPMDDEARDAARRAGAAARRKLRTRNAQVGPQLLPDFYERYFDVDVSRKAKYMTDDIKQLINDAKESGVWTEMQKAIAEEGLLRLDTVDMNKVISDVKKRRGG